MQFIKNGPDVPDTLLEAHEEGRVIFFCGSGISYPANLPDFKGLVNRTYLRLGTSKKDLENRAYSTGRYDATLDLLERRYPGGRFAVRQELLNVLQPNLKLPAAIKTHEALLKLSCGRDGTCRLVTTNFDKLFEFVIKRDSLAIERYPAPLLPIPKISRWNGLVYLHGLLPDGPDESALNRLVITSGDFGLAYLIERWAARFVSELFRNFTVCFVGYSINDPVLRYMMDALAADRMLGEVIPHAYALGDFSSGKSEQKSIEWKAKGVVPILYEVPSGSRDHSALHKTLEQWANTYRDGVRGKERIVMEYAISKPVFSTKQDDYVGRMLWALSEKSGLPAARFADFNPVPSLEWLDALDDQRYGHFDLLKFGVPTMSQPDEKLTFSMLRRPSPYTHAPWMAIDSTDSIGPNWDNVMSQLSRWLVRHLNDPSLLLRLTRRSGKLNVRLSRMIESRLDEISKLQRDNKTDELERIRADAPNAIPTPTMRMLWEFVLSGRVR